MNLSSHLRLALAACLLLFLWCDRCAAQDAKPPHSPSATFEVNVNKVLVQVVVRDKQGRVVGDLKREDFQIFDNDKSQPVSGFLIERRALRMSSPDGGNKTLVASGGASPSGASLANAAPHRFVVFLFDDMHLSFEDLVHAQKAGAKVLSEALGEADMAAVVSVSGKTNSGLTRDQAKLKDAIMGLQPRGVHHSTGADCPDIDYYQADQIENKHDSMALEAAIQQVFNCAPGMDRQRNRDVAERMAESAAMRVLNLASRTFTRPSPQPRRLCTEWLGCQDRAR